MSLISAAYLRKFNGIGQNIDDHVVESCIFKAEEQLKFLIGKEFYDELVTQYESADNTDGFTAENLSFYDPYLIQWIAKYAYTILLYRNSYEVVRSGIRILNEETSNPVTDKILGEILKQEKQEAEQYKGRMINFLKGQQKADSSRYPLYEDDCGDKIGTTFHITAVSKTEDVNLKIQNQINNNGI